MSAQGSMFYSSRAGRGGSSKGFRGSMFGGGLSRQDFNGSMVRSHEQRQETLTTLKHDFNMSRIMAKGEFLDRTKNDASDDETLSGCLADQLFSTSDRERSPQNDVEFDKRARKTDEEAKELVDKLESVCSTGQDVSLDKLMRCLANCGYEFDNEEIFYANKAQIMKAYNVKPADEEKCEPEGVY